MCWSGEASAVLATVGFSATVYIAREEETKELWIPLAYFSFMELLQASIYVYIDECGHPANRFLTFLGYFHIAFQPFFVNMAAMYFIPEQIKLKIRKTVYTLCAVGAIAILSKLLPITSEMCSIGAEGFCGATACSLSGVWHIAWQLPLNGLMSGSVKWLLGFEYGLHAFTYILVGFIMPTLYGSWKLVGFHYLVGPVISDLTTSDPNEFIAVWCLFSIALCLSVIKTPIRNHLHVKAWPLYGRVVLRKLRWMEKLPFGGKDRIGSE